MAQIHAEEGNVGGTNNFGGAEDGSVAAQHHAQLNFLKANMLIQHAHFIDEFRVLRQQIGKIRLAKYGHQSSGH
ncbi:hypothetical protein GCM10027027_11170 [Neomicrococcus lactis]